MSDTQLVPIFQLQFTTTKCHRTILRPLTTQMEGDSLLGSVFRGYTLQAKPNDPNEVIKRFGIFKFCEDHNATPWHVLSPLNMTPPTKTLHKFKYHLPMFAGYGTCTMDDHLSTSLNYFNNIGENSNDICMRMFVITCVGKFGSNFYNFLLANFSNWV